MSWQSGQNSGWAGLGDNLYAHPQDRPEWKRLFPEAGNYAQSQELCAILNFAVGGLADFTNVVETRNGLRMRRYRDGRPLERAHDAPAGTPATTAAEKRAYTAACEKAGVKLPMGPWDAEHPAMAERRAEIVGMLRATHPSWKE